MSERFLVTGAMGCIGAWTVKQLVEAGVPVWTYDLPGSDHRLRLIMSDEALALKAEIEVAAGAAGATESSLDAWRERCERLQERNNFRLTAIRSSW